MPIKRPAFQSLALFDLKTGDMISKPYKYACKRLRDQASLHPDCAIRPLPCAVQLPLLPACFRSARLGGMRVNVLSWGAR